MEMDCSVLQAVSERTINARSDNIKDAGRRGIIEESPAAKLLSACGRAPFHFSDGSATFVAGLGGATRSGMVRFGVMSSELDRLSGIFFFLIFCKLPETNGLQAKNRQQKGYR
jgi:hypothetical protein